jgi:hypothetical protein
MGALAYDTTDPVEPESHRNRLLRMLDALAEQHMRHSHRVISRGHDERADITSVTQPSSGNTRSNASPCDR